MTISLYQQCFDITYIFKNECEDKSPNFYSLPESSVINCVGITRYKTESSAITCVGITRYKTRFGYIVKPINCVEEDRLASIKYSR
jgi:hypothetical protein